MGNDYLGPFKDLLKFNRRKIYIDNVGFRVHYRWTVLPLIAFSILVTSRQYFGDPINCISSGDIKKIADDYCWIHATFTKGRLDKGKWIYEAIKENEIHPGVLPNIKDEDIIYHTYYQWVWLVLLIQAIIFFYPHWIWKKLEGGRIKMIVANLNLPMMMLDEDKRMKHIRNVKRYFTPNRNHHNRYALYHIICEIVNLFNIVSQLYAMDLFLNHEFSTYGLNLLYISQTRPYLRDDPLTRVFPTMASCRISTGGVAFGKNVYDLLCVLPINILNEKIYIFLWFWFMIVAHLTILSLVYRCCTFIPRFRLYLLHRKTRYLDEDSLINFIVDCSYGDWFIIYKLGQNMDPVTYGCLIKELASHFQENNPDIESPLKMCRSLTP